MTENKTPLLSHLLELRMRIIYVLVGILGVFLCLVSFSNNIYDFISQPLVTQLPIGTTMIATDVASPLLTPIKLTLLASVFLAIPLVLYQFWAFIAPGLYRSERKLIFPLLFASSLLFYLGVAFAYYVVFPLIFSFFVNVAPENITLATDISSYLDFVLTLFFAFGVAFEIPVAIVILCRTGITTPQSLKQKRPYIILLTFIIGMLLTPPDILSQTLLAVPMCLLYEVGIFFSTLKKEAPKSTVPFI